MNDGGQVELEECRARLAVAEELARLMGEALDLIPVSSMGLGHEWLPSPEALALIQFAKDQFARFES